MTRDVSDRQPIETSHQRFLACVLSTENFLRKLKAFRKESKDDLIEKTCLELEDWLKFLLRNLSKSFYKGEREEAVAFQENRILLVRKIIDLQLNSFRNKLSKDPFKDFLKFKHNLVEQLCVASDVVSLYIMARWAVVLELERYVQNGILVSTVIFLNKTPKAKELIIALNKIQPRDLNIKALSTAVDTAFSGLAVSLGVLGETLKNTKMFLKDMEGLDQLQTSAVSLALS